MTFRKTDCNKHNYAGEGPLKCTGGKKNPIPIFDSYPIHGSNATELIPLKVKILKKRPQSQKKYWFMVSILTKRRRITNINLHY